MFKHRDAKNTKAKNITLKSDRVPVLLLPGEPQNVLVSGGVKTDGHVEVIDGQSALIWVGIHETFSS